MKRIMIVALVVLAFLGLSFSAAAGKKCHPGKTCTCTGGCSNDCTDASCK
jgi:hypothetical protein